MRLIDITDLDNLKFYEPAPYKIPQYAILSHRWLPEGEVTFQEFLTDTGREKAGYEKIKQFADQARKIHLKYVWVDTCCIDKTSSAELSEAINSMFRWYRDAEVCFAYLSDVPDGEDPSKSESSFLKSEWFLRGWTLQELIAPKELLFCSQGWQDLGTKSGRSELISSVTGIDEEILTKTEGVEEELQRRFGRRIAGAAVEDPLILQNEQYLWPMP